MYTTLNDIRSRFLCDRGWKTLLKYLGKTCADDEPLSLSVVLKSNGFDDAVWCLRAIKRRYPEKIAFALKCVREVQHLLDNPVCFKALDVVEAYTKGQASGKEVLDAKHAVQLVADEKQQSVEWAVLWLLYAVVYAIEDFNEGVATEIWASICDALSASCSFADIRQMRLRHEQFFMEMMDD
jgi:hypothetical protein